MPDDTNEGTEKTGPNGPYLPAKVFDEKAITGGPGLKGRPFGGEAITKRAKDVIDEHEADREAAYGEDN